MKVIHLLITVLTLKFLTLMAVHASFAYCVGLNGPHSFGREVVAFRLWNDDGTEAAQYRSVYWAKKTKLQNNGWTVDLQIKTAKYISMTKAYFSHQGYGFDGEVPGEYACALDDTIHYYGCYSSPNSDFCNQSRTLLFAQCRGNISMGSRSVQC